MGAGKVTARGGGGGHIQVIGPDLSVQMSYVQTDTGQIPRTNPEWEIQETPRNWLHWKAVWICGVGCDGFVF